MALNVIERLWHQKSFTYPDGAHIPDIAKKSACLFKPSTISQKAALRRLSSSKVSQTSADRVLRKYSMTMTDQPIFIDSASDSDEEREEIEIESHSIKRDSTTQRHVTLSPDIIEGKSSTLSETKSKSTVDRNLGSSLFRLRKSSIFKQNRPSVAFAIPEEPSNDSNISGQGYNFQGNWYPVQIKHEFHKIIYNLVNSKTFSGFILTIILLNTLILIASTSHLIQARVGWYFTAIDHVFLAIYVMEIVLKLYALRAYFFKEGWNILDLVIVIFNLIDFLVPLVLHQMRGLTSGAAIFKMLRLFKAARAIRALRVLRTIRFLSNLQVIMTTVLKSIKSIGAIVILISLFMYMFAVIGRGIYAKADPDHFGNLFSALFTLFQLLTLDDWFEIYETIIENDPGRWHIMIYLLLYILVEYFIFLNLFVAVLVDNFQLALEAQNSSKGSEIEEEEHINKAHLSNTGEESESGTLSEEDSEEEVERKDIKHYTIHQTSDKERNDLEKYFALLASLEYNTFSLEEQQRILHMMVNLCVDTSDTLS